MRTPTPSPPENASDALLRDARHAARSLRRAPGFAATALLTLAAGVAVAAPALGVVLAGWARPAPDDVPAALDPAAGGRLVWREEARTAARVAHEGMDSLLAVLAGLVAVTLGIACVNLAILLLSRAAARRHEMAMRAALGAGRWRLARQLLAEGGLLGGAGAAAGAVLGTAGALALRARWPEGVAPFPGGPVHLPALGIAAGALAGAALLFGLAPAAAATRRGLGGVLTVGGRGTGGPLEAKLRNGLMVLAVGCSTVLLVGTGLLARGSAPPADRVDAGIDPRDTLTMRVELPGAPEDAAGRAALLGRILRGVEAVPGARAGSVSSEGAWTGMGTEDRVRSFCLGCSRGYIALPVWDEAARHHAVSPGFFRAHGIPVLRGREIAASDTAGAAPVAVVSRVFAYRLFPGREALGKKVRVGSTGDRWYTVVGIVEEVHPRGLGAEAQPVPAIYLSALQHPPRSVGLAVRAPGDPMRLEAAVRAAVRAAAPGARTGEAATLEEVLARFGAPLRWFGMLFGTLAAAAALIAATGVYGVMSYNVLRRTREVGIRMALGARGREVVWLIVGSAGRLTLTGAVLGLWGAAGLARLLELRFRGVDSLDLPVYAAVAVLLGALALAGSWVPARRATRVDPMVALRAD